MKQKLLATALAMTAPGLAAAQSPLDPQEGEFYVPYEMNVYDTAAGEQGPGFQLATPGDMIRYTYVIDNEYANDPNYEISRVIFGVHILDKDRDDFETDTAPEWGQVLVNGKPGNHFFEGFSTEFMEMKSDTENMGRPPYVFGGPEVVQDNQVVLEVINLNSEGGTDRSAPYGDFNVLRGGLHIFYKEKGA